MIYFLYIIPTAVSLKVLIFWPTYSNNLESILYSYLMISFDDSKNSNSDSFVIAFFRALVYFMIYTHKCEC